MTFRAQKQEGPSSTLLFILKGPMPPPVETLKEEGDCTGTGSDCPVLLGGSPPGSARCCCDAAADVCRNICAERGGPSDKRGHGDTEESGCTGILGDQPEHG